MKAKVNKMSNIKYPYPRADLTIRVSKQLLDLVHEACYELGITVQDISIIALLQLLDPTCSMCPDWEPLPEAMGYKKDLIP